MQPDTSGMPPFWTAMSIYSLPSRYLVVLLAKTARNIFPSMFNREMVLNCSTFLEFSSFGIKHPSALYHDSVIFLLLQITFNSFHNLLISLGQFLYTLYEIPFGPGADPALAFLTTSCTSWNFRSDSSNCSFGSSGVNNFSHSSRSSPRLSSLWVLLRCSSTSSLEFFSLPDPLAPNNRFIY